MLLRTTVVLTLVAALAACRGDIYIDDSPGQPVTTPDAAVESFYLLNEGNMGSNRASIDFYDSTDGDYIRNIYTLRNPSQVKELGDVGNDITIYGSRMYAVINCSHKVEVLRASDCVSLGHIDIPNPRYAIGHGPYVYISSYVSPVQVNPRAPRGAVFRVDTASMTVIDRVDVGYQPEEMAIIGNNLYVANSGGYRAPDYDNTISVVNLSSLAVSRTITVAPNLHRLRTDKYGRLLVTSRGDNSSVPPALYAVDPASGQTVAVSNVPVTNLAVAGDTLYTFTGTMRGNTGSTAFPISYNTLDTRSLSRIGTYVPDSLAQAIRMPYSVAVGPRSGRIYLTDARNYVSSGRVHCIGTDCRLLWTAVTGDIPASIAFLP